MSKNDKIFPLTQNLTLINDGKVLDKRTGNILNLKNTSVLNEIKSYFTKNILTITNLQTQAEVVTSVGSSVIDFYLKTSDGIIETKDGFLIEVFESGSDGKLTRLYQEDLNDPVDENKVVDDGFSNYFTVEVDK